MSTAKAIRELRKAYDERRLVLYLGAGVSVDSALLTWDHLVSAMYFAALSQDSGQVIKRAYRNYLLAISEWYLKQNAEPIEITARKIRAFYTEAGSREFLRSLHDTLYTAMLRPGGGVAPVEEIRDLLRGNETLMSVKKLCSGTLANPPGVRAVVTYNYDNLLEMCLSRGRLENSLRRRTAPQSKPARRERYQSIWRESQEWDRRSLPVYHVHGFVPLNRQNDSSTASEVVFTEEEFNLVANNAYSWSNLVQLECMTNSVGLAIGLSMTDRNMRRLLDACRQTPLPPRIYALLPRTPAPQLTDHELDSIRDAASDHLARFSRSAGMKAEGRELRQVEEIIRAVHDEGEAKRDDVLHELGVEVLALRDFAELPPLIDRIRGQ